MDERVTDDEVWQREEQFWLAGPSFYAAHLAPECVMAFPPPFGVLGRADIRASLAGAPRWDSVTMTERIVGRPDDTTLVVGYRAEGRRAGAPAYLAYCTSTYRRDGRAWRLVQHQQTPAQ